jgi:hypothetical protein
LHVAGDDVQTQRSNKSVNTPVGQPKIKEFSCLPTVTDTNVFEQVLVVNDVCLTLRDLKSLDKCISEEELYRIEVVEKAEFPGMRNLIPGHLTENIVVSYLTLICDDRSQIVVKPAEFTRFVEGRGPLIAKRYSWKSVNMILLPFMNDNFGWVLLLVDCKAFEITGKSNMCVKL